MSSIFWFTVNAIGCAVNVGMYAWAGDPISLAVAVFTGFVALLMLARVVTE